MTTALRYPRLLPFSFRAARKDLAIPANPLSDELGCAVFTKDRQSFWLASEEILMYPVVEICSKPILYILVDRGTVFNKHHFSLTLIL